MTTASVATPPSCCARCRPPPTWPSNPVRKDLRALLCDVAMCSPRVSVVERHDGEQVPSFGIAALGQAPRLRFAGLPLGHEFSSPMRALLQVEAFRVIDRQAP